MPKFISKTEINVPRPFAFRWHQGTHAFERLTPQWEKTKMISREGDLKCGTVKLKTKAGPFWLGITSRHSQFVQDEKFFDEMLKGPFSSWRHEHLFSDGPNGDSTLLTDQIEYRVPAGILGRLIIGRMVRNRLQQLFDYRKIILQTEIADHYQTVDQPRKTIAVTGSSGMVGNSICHFLSCGGHRVIRLPRKKASDDPTKTGWIPETGEVQFGTDIPRVDCFLHLAGYGLGEKRWNQKTKDLIYNSRVDSTEKLANFLADRQLVSESFICASATGIYGDRATEELVEESIAGNGFLAETCQKWEAASNSFQETNTRVLNLRFGIILSASGGALQKMLLPFQLGLGGKIGTGKQFWSWISLFDTLRAIHFCIMNEQVTGPVNFCSTNPVSQREFANKMGRVLFRPALLPLPAFAAKIVLGEMAEHLLLTSANVVPQKLTNCGFRFVHNKLEEALRFELGRLPT